LEGIVLAREHYESDIERARSDDPRLPEIKLPVKLSALACFVPLPASCGNALAHRTYEAVGETTNVGGHSSSERDVGKNHLVQSG